MARLRQPVEALPPAGAVPEGADPWEVLAGGCDERLAVDLFLAARWVTADLGAVPPAVAAVRDGRWVLLAAPAEVAAAVDGWLAGLGEERRRAAWFFVLEGVES